MTFCVVDESQKDAKLKKKPVLQDIYYICMILFYKMFRKSRLIETESRLMISWGKNMKIS